MGKWVEAQDVLNRWIGGGAPAVNSPVLETLIEDVEDAVLEIFPSIQIRIDSTELPLSRMKRVIAGVVIRYWNVGQEFRTSYSETTGPFAHGASYATGAGKGIKLTDDEIKSLSPDRTKRAFTVSMAPRAHSHHPWWDGGYDCD